MDLPFTKITGKLKDTDENVIFCNGECLAKFDKKLIKRRKINGKKK